MLNDTDNSGTLKWLKKNDEIGKPASVKVVVNALATLRQLETELIESLVQNNFRRLIADDPWLKSAHALLGRSMP